MGASGTGRGRTGGRRTGIALRGFFVGIAAVIGLVKAATLEHNGRPAADQTAQPFLAAHRAFFERFIFDILELFKFMRASITTVFVSGHGFENKSGFPKDEIAPSLPERARMSNGKRRRCKEGKRKPFSVKGT